MDNDSMKPTRLILIFQYGIKLNFFSQFYEGFLITNLTENCLTSISKYVPNANVQKICKKDFPFITLHLCMILRSLGMEANYPF